IEQRVLIIGDDELNLRSQVKELKSEQSTISMTEEFAKHAKLQRKIDKFTKEIKRLASQRSQKMTMVNMAVKVGIKVIHTITMLSLIIWYRNVPLLMFPEGVFWPFFIQKFVAFPTGVPGKTKNIEKYGEDVKKKRMKQFCLKISVSKSELNTCSFFFSFNVYIHTTYQC
ncbi:hypothetical protein FSP39_016483, partial [Pinctada imbricata]